MIVIKRPNIRTDYYTDALFLAGGITDCPLWQNVVIDYLKDAPFLIDNELMVINPRVDNYEDTEKFERDQVYWESYHLKYSQAIIFWLTPPTVNPITLFELGRYITSGKKLFIGIHPEYRKRNNVELQIYCHLQEMNNSLISGEQMCIQSDNCKISYSLENLVDRVIEWRKLIRKNQR